MEMTLINLDREVHALLKKKGYQYFLITNLQLNDEKVICWLVVKALKQIPANLQYSCTGIDDPMITSFINRSGMDCDTYVEPFE